jgi:hypothetical protein
MLIRSCFVTGIACAHASMRILPAYRGACASEGCGCCRCGEYGSSPTARPPNEHDYSSMRSPKPTGPDFDQTPNQDVAYPPHHSKPRPNTHMYQHQLARPVYVYVCIFV